MTSIGIGELKTAPKRPQDAGASMLRAHKKIAQKREAEASKEGQLSVDIFHSETEMIIVCPIAGVDKTDVQVVLNDDVLTIRGERRRMPELENKTCIVSELYWGTFSRSIVLPDYIDRKNIKAQTHENLLVVKIPKTEDFKTRVIEISEPQ